MVMGVVSKVLIRKITLEICGPALTVCLSHNPPQPVRAFFLPVPDVLRHRADLERDPDLAAGARR